MPRPWRLGGGPLEAPARRHLGRHLDQLRQLARSVHIQVDFDLGRNVDGAAQDVQTAISAAGGQLPKNMPNPPTYEKVNPADALLMSVAVTSVDLTIRRSTIMSRTTSLPASRASPASARSTTTVSRSPRCGCRSTPRSPPPWE